MFRFRHRFWHCLLTLRAGFDLTYIFISHDLAVIEAFCDRVAVMYFGEVVEVAAANSIFARCAHPYTNLLARTVPRGEMTYSPKPKANCRILSTHHKDMPFRAAVPNSGDICMNLNRAYKTRLEPMSPATLQMKIEKNDGPRASKPLRVAEAIKHWVVAEGMRPGDKLPSEAELMERYGHSKGTIREAMRILEAQGLLKTRTVPVAAASSMRFPKPEREPCLPTISISGI